MTVSVKYATTPERSVCAHWPAARPVRIEEHERISFDGEGLAHDLAASWLARFLAEHRASAYYRRSPAEADARLVAGVFHAVAEIVGARLDALEARIALSTT